MHLNLNQLDEETKRDKLDWYWLLSLVAYANSDISDVISSGPDTIEKAYKRILLIETRKFKDLTAQQEEIINNKIVNSDVTASNFARIFAWLSVAEAIAKANENGFSYNKIQPQYIDYKRRHWLDTQEKILSFLQIE